MNLKYSIIILISILLIGSFSFNMNSVQAGVSYTLEVQKPDGAWTTGLASGWTECDEVPTRFIFNYKILSIDPDLEVMLDLEGAYKDTDTFVNFGLDYFSDFSYTDTGGGVHLFEIEGTWPYSGGLGTGTEVPGSSGIKNLRYVGEFHITSGTSGTLTIEWKSHLATSPNGASEWIGPPSANLQVSAEPRGLHGEKTVNIKKPDGSIFVSKTAEGEFLTDYYWTVEKTASPPGPIDLYVGGYQEINYTINVTRAEVENPYRMRGAITITNTYDHDICVDVLDQVEVGPYTPGDDPGTAIGTPTAKWTWNNQIVPANDQLVLYFPGLTASDWFEFDSGVSTSTTYYNIVWVGFNEDLEVCPVPDATDPNTDFSVEGDYDNVISAYDDFIFDYIELEEYYEATVTDYESDCGNIEIKGDPIFDPPGHPWTVGSNGDEPWTFEIDKTIECTGPGTCYLGDWVEVTPIADSNLLARYPESGTLVVTFYQTASYDFGDAPDDPYPTYDSSTGAKHLIGDIWLGATVDGESEGQPLPPAYGDDNNGVDDEDGVVFPSLPYYVGTTGSVRITVSGSVDGNNPAYLHGWIDWNQDGDWGDPSENLFSGYIVTAPGIYQIDFPVPSDAVPGSTYARFRVDDEDLNSVTGEAGNGEVEDYLVDPAVAIIPPRRPVAVGGFLMPVDELTILAPYLAIMISAILMSSIIVLRKKYRN
jgi:hypothetical protein